MNEKKKNPRRHRKRLCVRSASLRKDSFLLLHHLHLHYCCCCCYQCSALHNQLRKTYILCLAFIHKNKIKRSVKVRWERRGGGGGRRLERVGERERHRQREPRFRGRARRPDIRSSFTPPRPRASEKGPCESLTD